jgi:acetyl-CoA carboxylase beta subunit
MLDGLNNKQIVHLGNVTVSGATPAVSAYVDRKGFEKCTLVIVNNTVTDAGTTSGYTVTLQESADTAGSSAGAVAAGDAVNGTVTVTVTSDSADNAIAGSMGYIGEDRYVGITVTGTTNSDADISVIAILETGAVEPPTLIGTAVSRT